MSTAQPVEIDVRDTSTGADPVAMVAAHLAAGSEVVVHDPHGAFPRFGLQRRGGSVVVRDAGGDVLATYADVGAALGHGLARWPVDLEAAAEAVIDGATRLRRPTRPLARMAAKMTRSVRR